MILYEYPFNERIRTYLRLEHLLRRLGTLAVREQPIDHHYAITTIFEVMDVAARADLKTDVLKDLEKQKNLLNGYRGNPAIAEAVLDDIIGQLENCFTVLSSQSGKAGHQLTENELLMSIRSRVGIPGGTCEFDLPAYFAWQHLNANIRQQDLQNWTATLLPLADSIRLLLQLLRDSGAAQKVITTGGQYQQTLPQGRTFQLLRLRIDPKLGQIPEISCNRLKVSIRMMRYLSDSRLHACTDDASFELTLCT